MEEKKKKRSVLLLLLLLFLLALGLLSVSRDLPFSHDPYEDESRTYHITGPDDKDDKQDTNGNHESGKQSEAGMQSEAGRQKEPEEQKGSKKQIETGKQDTKPNDTIKEVDKVIRPETKPPVKDEKDKTPVEDSKPEDSEQEREFSVADDSGNKWETVSDVNIFANEEYEGKSIIAPESTGVYRFIVSNNEGKSVTYRIETREENEGHIPMLYRLKCNGIYVGGWMTSDKISFQMKELKSGKRDILELEWKWKSGNTDTAIGENAEQLQYHLYLRLHAEGVSS